MAAVKPGRLSARRTSRRVPLTITLDANDLQFVESCVSLKEFDNVDKLFEAALMVYRRHLHAINAYAEEQSHKGYSRDEILASIECETVVTKLVRPRQPRRR